jgi:hypothetical protein
MSSTDSILNPPGPPYDTELMRLDRLARFLVLADEMPESGFRHFGLTGRMTRICFQLGWTVEDAHEYIGQRYLNYLGYFQSRPSDFLETTERLRRAYGDDLLRRWGALAAE